MRPHTVRPPLAPTVVYCYLLYYIFEALLPPSRRHFAHAALKSPQLSFSHAALILTTPPPAPRPLSAGDEKTLGVVGVLCRCTL